MSFFPNVGPLTFIAPGQTHYWEYGWGPGPDHGLNTAGPNFLNSGFAGSGKVLVAFDQAKQHNLHVDGSMQTPVYFVSIKNVNPDSVLYNLQVGGFE